MGETTISLREDVYRDLEAEKRDDESFSDVLERLLEAQRGEHPLYHITGILDDEEAERVRERAQEFRDSVDEEMDRYFDGDR